MVRISLVAAGLLLLGQGSLAAAGQAPAAKPKPAKGSPDERICRSEAPTGSLIASKRICMTRAQWQAQADENRDFTQGLQEKGHTTTCNSPGGC